MKEKPSKRVVIINDIASDSIEQAIFILRNAGIQGCGGGTPTIVQEAQRVINAYVETMEKTQQKISRQERKERRKSRKHLWGRVLLALLPLAVFCSAIGLALYLL